MPCAWALPTIGMQFPPLWVAFQARIFTWRSLTHTTSLKGHGWLQPCANTSASFRWVHNIAVPKECRLHWPTFVRGTWGNALWPRHGRAPSRAISVGLPMAWHPRRWTTTCGWVPPPSDPSIPGVSMAAGAGFMITGLGTSVMTACTGWTWLLLH